MLGMKFIRKFKRDRARDLVLRDGKALRRVQAQRANIDAAQWPVDAQYLDAEINRLDGRVERARTYLKETA